MARQENNDGRSVVVRGRVERLFCSRPGFTAGVIRQSGGETVRFAGPFTVCEDDFVIFEGRVQSTEWGMQLQVARFEPDMELDLDGLTRFLALSKKFKGIGASRAKEIASRFGKDFDRIVVDEPERLLEIKGVTKEIAGGLREEWLARRSQGKAIAYLSGFGLTPYQVDKIMEKLGNSALAVVRENPYILLELVDGFGFRRVDDIALKTGTNRDAPGRLRAGVLYAMQKAAEDGHTCRPKGSFVEEAIELMVLDSDDAYTLAETAIQNLLNDGSLVEFTGRDGAAYLALASLYKAETYLAAAFQKWGAPA